MKSSLQTLLRREMKCKTLLKKEIQGLRCLKDSIDQNIQECIHRRRESIDIRKFKHGNWIVTSSLINGSNEISGM